MRHVAAGLAALIVTLAAPLDATLQAQPVSAPAALRTALAGQGTAQPATVQPAMAMARVHRAASRNPVIRTMTVDEGPPIEQAIVGAGVGFLFGAVLGSELAERCRPAIDARCTANNRRVKYIVAYGLLGAIVGGAAGTIAGGQK